MKGLSFFKWLIVATCLSFARSLIITENTVEISPPNLVIEDLEIYPKVYFSIVNNLLTTIEGNLSNKGKFYVTSLNGLDSSVSLTSGTIFNSGTIAFNSTNANTVSSYILKSIGSFENHGFFWMGISSYSSESPIVLTSETQFVNSGDIYLRQNSGKASSITISSHSGSISNKEGICIERLKWKQTSSIEGYGCINIMDGALFELQIQSLSIAEEHSFYLSSPSSILKIEGVSSGLTSSKLYNLIGLGSGNKIQFDTDFTDFSYKDGILTLEFPSSFNISFNIGNNYQASHFVTDGEDNSGSTISYIDPFKDEIPAKCLCPDFSEPPTKPLPSSTSKQPESSLTETWQPSSIRPESSTASTVTQTHSSVEEPIESKSSSSENESTRNTSDLDSSTVDTTTVETSTTEMTIKYHLLQKQILSHLQNPASP
ncbi:hypothetical protein RJF_2812 [Candidozyma auris]